jgi:hypothetical protein
VVVECEGEAAGRASGRVRGSVEDAGQALPELRLPLHRKEEGEGVGPWDQRGIASRRERTH